MCVCVCVCVCVCECVSKQRISKALMHTSVCVLQELDDV